MSPVVKLLLFYFVFVNGCAFAAYGIDKYKAKKSMWRIPESTLILLAFFGGALGAFAGMHIFHHKTLHTQFRVLVPLALVLWCALIGLLVWHTMQ
ncbi:MAG: DUF1294 domain-containing protein [Solobacterium sp.]|nr:DUF1294 domain-containing protein [Solobacterium sp.]